MPEWIVIGGGLAGSEAAWQAAEKGIHVTLFEMRPKFQTGAHTSGYLGELVCSETTMIGALSNYVTHASAADFQPMKANFGLLPPFVGDQAIKEKRKRYQAYTDRALKDLDAFIRIYQLHKY